MPRLPPLPIGALAQAPTMTTFDHLLSDVPFGGRHSAVTTGVLHLASSNNSSWGPYYYRCTTSVLVDEAIEHFRARGLDIAKFTTFSSQASWDRLYGAIAPLQSQHLMVADPSAPTTPSRPPIVPPPPPDESTPS